MAQTFAVADADRLPWLPDEAKRRKRSNPFVVPFLAASAVAIIAALSFWLGLRGGLTPEARVAEQAQASVELPVAITAPAEPALEQQVSVPQVEPVPVPAPVALPHQDEVLMEAPPVKRVAKLASVTVHHSRPVAKKLGAAKAKAEADPDALKYTNPWKSAGSSGRMIRVGAYGSLEKGKAAWQRLAEISPAIKQLPAVVTDLQSPSGRTLYWLQIGTTSQAHSEVLCQRMRAIRQNCVVVDLPGARKGSGNGRQSVGV